MLKYYFKYLFKMPPIEEFIEHNSIFKKTFYKTVSCVNHHKLEEIYKKYINKYKDKINWEEFSFIIPENVINVSNDYGRSLCHFVNWDVVSTRSDLTEDFIFSNRNILNWDILSGKCAKLYQSIEIMKIFRYWIDIKNFFTSREFNEGGRYDIMKNRMSHQFRLNIFEDVVYDYKKEYTYLHDLFFHQTIEYSNIINWNNYYSDWVRNILFFEKKYIEENKKYISISDLPNLQIIYEIIKYYPIDLKVVEYILDIYQNFISIKRDIIGLSINNCFLLNLEQLEKDNILRELTMLSEKIEKENTQKNKKEKTLFLDLED